MEELKNWEIFNLINHTDIKNAFQRMCTYLFCYTYSVENLDEEPNHPGIETYPITYEGKKYGFQCKHFDKKVGYNQIIESVDALIESTYSASLDFLVLYCNRNFSDCPSYKIIKKKLEDNKITLIPVCNEEILRLITTNKYYIIYNLFFKKALLLDNYKFNITKDTTLGSIIDNNLIDLSLAGTLQKVKLSKLSELKLLKKVILIEGYAGSGKTVAIYYMYRLMTFMDINTYEQAAKLVHKKIQYIYINFKTHTYNCKERINQIINEIETNFNNHKAVLFFDGFDEMTDFRASEISAFINEISLKNVVEHIFISCRSLSLKRYYLTHNISDIDILKIEPLNEEDKLQYAKNSLNKENFVLFKNLLKTNKLLAQVEDPLCLKYITENISSIEDDSSIFDIIKISLANKFKIDELNILENKINNIFILIGNIAFEIYLKEKNYITLDDINIIIQKQFPKLNYYEINKSVDQLKNCGVLIECEGGLTFQHKRVLEYFLIENIYHKYLYDINILAKTNLFKYEDLFENLFLSRLKKDVMKSSELNLPLEYNLFNTYMNKNNSFSADDPAFMISNFFVDAFCAFDDQTIIDLINSNSKLKNYFDSTKCTTKQMKQQHSKRVYRFIKRIKSSQVLSDYFKDLLPDMFYFSFEEAVELYNQLYDDANDYVKKVLENDNGQYLFEVEYYSIFCKFFEFAIAKCKHEERKNIIDKLNASQLDWLCRTIFSPNLMSLLFDEEIIENIKMQIEKLSLNTMNTKIFKYFCNTASETDIESIKQEKDKLYSSSDLDRKHNFVYILSMLDKFSMNHQEDIFSYKSTLSLLKNEISCSEYVDEVYDYFEYIRCNNGKYGRQYHISYFVLQFIESKVTNDNISIECCKIFLNKRYLNIQLLSRLKRSKPQVADKVLNEGVLSRISDIDIMALSSIEDRSEQLFQLSFLFNGYDYKTSLKYFYDGYANSIVRIGWRKDAILDPMLVRSYISIYDYLSQKDRKKYLVQIFNMIEWTDIFTDDGGQIETFEELANYIYFESKKEVCKFINLLNQNNYWNENIAFGILETMLKHYFNVDEIWSVYNDEIKYTFHSESPYLFRKLELKFFLNILNRCALYDNLHDTVEELLNDDSYKNLEITLTHKQKNLFDIICKDNHAKYQINNNYTDIEDMIDTDNIDWENGNVYYWTDLINDLYDNGKDATVLISNLKDKYYPNIGYQYTNLNLLLFAGLENKKSHTLFYNYLLDNSGYCGFYCLIDAYKNNPKIALPLYKRYHQFCQLLTR